MDTLMVERAPDQGVLWLAPDERAALDALVAGGLLGPSGYAEVVGVEPAVTRSMNANDSSTMVFAS